MKKMILFGCGGSAGINFVKSLRLCREKVKIIGFDINRYYIELSPVDQRYLIPAIKQRSSETIDKVNELIKKGGIDFVHAQPDPEVGYVSEHREKFNAKTFFPSKEAVKICHDKMESYKTWKSKGVPVAKTIQIQNEGSLEKVFNELKGTVWIRASKGAGGKASLPVDSVDEARMWIRFWTKYGLMWNDFIASEFLPGEEIAWNSVWADGKLLCSQGRIRIEWVQAGLTPSGVTGTTAIQKTVHDDSVNEIATKAIEAVDKKPNGIFSVDIKQDPEGNPKVTEINPGRFSTTSLFFSTYGVNMPEIYLKAAYGEKIKGVSPYNSVEKDVYWIRIPDGGPVMVKGDDWKSKPL